MPSKKTSSAPASSAASSHAGAAAATQVSKVTSIESRPPASAHTTADANAQYAIEERIRFRAYELYEERGRHDGFADQDWLRAEAELRPAAEKRSA
ncbi:MAG TPA: DUF2934 domain-containing protein [Terriglobales bacterium]|nr:DUF2934 domain-containing protein [Terriglobales bacterium]